MIERQAVVIAAWTAKQPNGIFIFPTHDVIADSWQDASTDFNAYIRNRLTLLSKCCNTGVDNGQ